MVFGPDERAQSTLVGFILLFGILVVAFASYQAVVVPNQNAEVEFNHNQGVQTDMQDLRNSLLDVRSVERINEGEYEVISEHRPARVQLGTQYPARLIALNPPHPTGSLQTEEPTSGVTIENADVTNADAFVVQPESVEELVQDDFEAGIDTRFISYQPQYNEYRSAPETVFEHSLLYNKFQEDDLVVRDQRLINDRRLNVLLFSGSVSRSSNQAVTLDPETIDGPTGPINITADNGPIEITLPTRTPGVWETESVIGSEFGEGATHARVTDTAADQVTIELEEGETYQLRATRVAFDGGAEENEFTPIQLADRDPPEIDPGDGALPGPRVFNAQGPDPSDEPLESGDTFDLTADVSNVGQTENRRGGTTIQAAEWYIEGDDPGEGNANPMDDVDGEYLNDVEVEVEDEVSANELEEGTNTLVIRGQDSRGVWSEDEDTDSVTVDVDGTAGPGAILADAEVESFDDGDTVQEFEFELGRDLNGGETVAIDLDDPQAPQQVDYRNSNVVTDGPGSVALSTPGNQEAEITYTASGDEEAGDSIEVTISQFGTGGRAVAESPYTVVFEGSDESTLTRQFQVEN